MLLFYTVYPEVSLHRLQETARLMNNMVVAGIMYMPTCGDVL